MAAERNELLRSAFIAKIGNGYVPEQFVFLDESAKDEQTLSRRYGYSCAGARSKVVFIRSKRYSTSFNNCCRRGYRGKLQ